MDDEAFEGHQNGRPRRHDGRDPWSLVARAEVLASPELLAALSDAPAPTSLVPAVGDTVAVLLRRERSDLQGRHEEVWLELTAGGGARLEAVFDSQPTYVRGLSAGDPLTPSEADVLRHVPVRKRPPP